jgi:hypothetical protein
MEDLAWHAGSGLQEPTLLSRFLLLHFLAHKLVQFVVDYHPDWIPNLLLPPSDGTNRQLCCEHFPAAAAKHASHGHSSSTGQRCEHLSQGMAWRPDRSRHAVQALAAHATQGSFLHVHVCLGICLYVHVCVGIARYVQVCAGICMYEHVCACISKY